MEASPIDLEKQDGGGASLGFAWQYQSWSYLSCKTRGSKRQDLKQY
jgi:hypothetical protein